MPLYRVEHSTPLTTSQRDALATAITDIHAVKFTTARMFVNVEFADISAVHSYVGGKPSGGRHNHIRAHVRSGASRTPADWEDVCRRIEGAWDGIVGVGLPRVRRAEGQAQANGDGDGHGASLGLRSVIILGGMIAGLEAGFALPPAGGDVQWLEENWEAFLQRAREGDAEFVDLVKEVEERGMLTGRANGESDRERARRIEEMMGWGDDA